MITETYGNERSLEQHMPINAHKTFGFDPTLAESFLLATSDETHGIKQRQGNLQGFEGIELALDLYPDFPDDASSSDISELQKVRAFEKKKRDIIGEVTPKSFKAENGLPPSQGVLLSDLSEKPLTITEVADVMSTRKRNEHAMVTVRSKLPDGRSVDTTYLRIGKGSDGVTILSFDSSRTDWTTFKDIPAFVRLDFVKGKKHHTKEHIEQIVRDSNQNNIRKQMDLPITQIEEHQLLGSTHREAHLGSVAIGVADSLVDLAVLEDKYYSDLYEAGIDPTKDADPTVIQKLKDARAMLASKQQADAVELRELGTQHPDQFALKLRESGVGNAGEDSPTLIDNALGTDKALLETAKKAKEHLQAEKEAAKLLEGEIKEHVSSVLDRLKEAGCNFNIEAAKKRLRYLNLKKGNPFASVGSDMAGQFSRSEFLNAETGSGFSYERVLEDDGTMSLDYLRIQTHEANHGVGDINYRIPKEAITELLGAMAYSGAPIEEVFKKVETNNEYGHVYQQEQRITFRALRVSHIDLAEALSTFIDKKDNLGVMAEERLGFDIFTAIHTAEQRMTAVFQGASKGTEAYREANEKALTWIENELIKDPMKLRAFARAGFGRNISTNLFGNRIDEVDNVT